MKTSPSVGICQNFRYVALAKTIAAMETRMARVSQNLGSCAAIRFVCDLHLNKVLLKKKKTNKRRMLT